jgi:hypothetical protein
VRWYLRFFIWFRFLWPVSRLDLHLVATHPDRSGVLSFLGKSSYAFSPILFAQGALLAGVIASRVLFGGESLLSFKMEAVSLVGFFLVFILGPLTMFTPQLVAAKRKGLSQYGLLASRYVDGFEQKWVVGNAAEGDELLGSADIQSHWPTWGTVAPQCKRCDRCHSVCRILAGSRLLLRCPFCLSALQCFRSKSW